jgi:AcrR family transcriptional regulator
MAERTRSTSEAAGKGLRRGRPATLTVRAICDAATRVIDRGGLDACTMRAVAAELNASPMSVYRHVADKDALLELLPDVLLEEVSRSVVRRRSAMTAMRAVAEGLADVLDEHPLAAPLFAQPTVGPNMLMAAEHSVALLCAAGWTEADAVEVLQAVVAQVIGEHVTRPRESDPHVLEASPTAARASRSWGVRLLLAGVAQGPPPGE